MIQAADNYVHGSAAKALKYDVYEENKVLKAKKNQKSNYKVKWRLAGYVIFIFALCLAVAYRYALITEINYNIDKATREYNYIRNKNILMKVEIDKELDLNTIKQTAEEKLAMHKPNKYQIVYVDVPKTDFTRVENAELYNVKTHNALAMLADRFIKLTRFFE